MKTLSNTDFKTCEIMSTVAALFMRSCENNIPDVNVELNSYNVSDGFISWTGDMMYNNSNVRLKIKLPKVLHEDTDGFELYKEVLSDMISSTISQIRDCYHIDPIDIIKQ